MYQETREEVEQALYDLIESGIVEARAIDEDGNFMYRLTEKGDGVAENLKNT
jgi:hypothetical protein